MSPRRRWAVAPDGGRHFAYAAVTEAEYAVLRQQAARAGLSISDYVRRCINSVWLEEGDDVPLLVERRRSRVDESRGAYD